MSKEELSAILGLVYHNHLTVEYATELIYEKLNQKRWVKKRKKILTPNTLHKKITQPDIDYDADDEKTYIDNFDYATYNTYDDHELNTRIRYYVLMNGKIINMIN